MPPLVEYKIDPRSAGKAFPLASSRGRRGKEALTVRFTHILSPLLLSLWLLTACEETSAPTSMVRAPIIDGAPETGEPAVVLVVNDLAGVMCSASVIGPRVVLTAKHCILDRTYEGWTVFVGHRYGYMDDQYEVVEVRTTPEESFENSDIAIFILDRDFEHETKRWAYTRWPGFVGGATITAIGYGQTDVGDSRSAGTKHRRDGRVLAIGPYPDWELADREFLTEDDHTCPGDSGGPLLFEDVVVGIVSRSEEECLGTGTATRVSAWTDMINEALRDTGACAPTGAEVCNGVDDDCLDGIDTDLGPTCGCSDDGAPIDEVCDGVDNDCNELIDDLADCGCTAGEAPEEEVCDGLDNDCNGEIDETCGDVGDPCDDDDECASLDCVEIGDESFCTDTCDNAVDCPNDWSCVDAENAGESICVPDELLAETENASEDTGCSCVAADVGGVRGSFTALMSFF